MSDLSDSQPEAEAKDRFRTRVRVLKAVRDRFVGAGLHDVEFIGDRYARLQLPGYRATLTGDLTGKLRSKGLGTMISDLGSDGVIIAFPFRAKRLEEVAAIIPLDTFIDLLAKQAKD